jgi:hypothetical protein
MRAGLQVAGHSVNVRLNAHAAPRALRRFLISRSAPAQAVHSSLVLKALPRRRHVAPALPFRQSSQHGRTDIQLRPVG